MQSNLAEFIKESPDGQAAKSLLSKCVRCGFCIATCPTYQVIGDERDSPRGRIDLIRQSLEGQAITAETQLHLDRCLTCRLCETTCPSGVQFGQLLDIGRKVVEAHVRRPLVTRLKRKLLRTIVPNATVFNRIFHLAQRFHAWLPSSLKNKVPRLSPVSAKLRPQRAHARKVLVLEGCVQPTLSPATNAAAARVLDRVEITLIPAQNAGCCGALAFHLNAEDEAKAAIRRNIDAWWPHITAGAEAVMITASGCGVMVKDYGRILENDATYAAKARRVSELTKDIGEIIASEKDKLLPFLDRDAGGDTLGTIAFHAPCTLQHGLGLKGSVENMLSEFGFQLAPVTGAHICCGSAGTHSILQPEIANNLRDAKIKALTADSPCTILTANIGCQSHLQAATTLPVRHWIEAMDDVLTSKPA